MDFRQRYFVWIDLETTGLNPEKDDILEIAVILTDRNLKTISKYHTLVAGADLDKLDPVVKAMHIKSGLAEDLERCSNFPLQSEIEDDLYNLLPSRGIYYFAGSSVHFDVAFLKEYFPKFCAKFSHRILDTSSLILAHEIRNKKFKNKVRKLEPQHRAETDIQTSLNFARKYYGKKRRWREGTTNMGLM